MKKFIVFCLMLIVTVSLGVTVWYFVRDNEELVIDMQPYVYMNKGETLPVDAELKHAKVGNELIISSLNENILVWNDELKVFEVAKNSSGGTAVIEIKTKKGKISPVYIEVSVGVGSETAPYYIDSEDDLLKIGNIFPASDNFVLMQDVTLSNAIKPLAYNGEFTGTFNGNGYFIRDLKIETAQGVLNAGLFGKIGSDGLVINLNLSNVSINGAFETAGAFAGINKGTITRCSVESGSVKSEGVGASVGGICGICEYSNSNKGRVDRCSSFVSVCGTENVGGIAGKNDGAIIINSYVNLGENGAVESLNSKSYVGGLVGLNTFKTKQNSENRFATVKNCYFVGNVGLVQGVDSSTETFVAQIIGFNNEQNENFSNNLMGLYTTSESILVNNGVNRVVVDGSAEKLNFRGYYGEFPLTAVNKIDQNKMISYMSRKLKSTSSDISSSSAWDLDLVYWDFENVWILNDNDYPVLNKNGANVADDLSVVYNPNEITNETDFRQFVADVNEGKAKEYYILTNDIILNGDYTPAGIGNYAFNGTFEGNGKTISGINISSDTIASSNYFAGLFANTTSNAVIQNLTVKNITMQEGATYAGGIVANNKGVIKNCVVTQNNEKFVSGCNIVGSFAVGGICGQNTGTIENCKVKNQVIWLKNSVETAQRFVGGISGINGVQNSSYSATIKNSSVVYSTVKDVLNKTEYDSNLGYDFKTNFNNVKYYVGGISGINFYLISSNYVFETDIEMNKFSKYGEVAGIVAYSKSNILMQSDSAEVVNNKLIGGNITGYIAAGLVCEQYGRIEYNQIGAGNEINKDKITFITNIEGAEIAGLVNKIYNGGRLFNCFVGVKLINTMQGTGHSAGFCNVNDYYAYNRWFGEEAVYGQFGQLFSLCTFENTEYWHCRYDCNMDYRYEAYFIRTPRNTGYGNNVIWIETSENCSYDDSPELLGFINESKQMNIKRLTFIQDAKIAVIDDTLAQVFTSYEFDMTRWNLEVENHPYLSGLPTIDEISKN